MGPRRLPPQLPQPAGISRMPPSAVRLLRREWQRGWRRRALVVGRAGRRRRAAVAASGRGQRRWRRVARRTGARQGRGGPLRRQEEKAMMGRIGDLHTQIVENTQITLPHRAPSHAPRRPTRRIQASTTFAPPPFGTPCHLRCLVFQCLSNLLRMASLYHYRLSFWSRFWRI